MKTIAICILIAVALFGTASLFGSWLKLIARRDTRPLSDAPKKTFEDLLDAIEWVESKGDANAVGDGGAAVGSFQIHKIYVDDVNRICKITHTSKYSPPMQYGYTDRKNQYLSRYMVNKYLRYYSATVRYYGATECLGTLPTLEAEALSRIHNAGPEGWRNDPEWFVRNRGYSLEHAKDKIANAKAYWAKVKMRLVEGE